MPQQSSEKTALAENASADLRKSIREASRTPKNCPRSASGHPKVALGVPRKRPGTPSEPPSDSPRSSPEPPKREYANQSRVSSFSTASREHLVPLGSPSPPRCRTTFTPFQLTPLSPTGPARSLPPRRTTRVGGVTGLGLGAGGLGAPEFDRLSGSRDRPER